MLIRIGKERKRFAFFTEDIRYPSGLLRYLREQGVAVEVVLVNIGPHPIYGGANQAALAFMADDLPSVYACFSGGYYTDGSITNAIPASSYADLRPDRDQKILAERGFEFITTFHLPSMLLGHYQA